MEQRAPATASCQAWSFPSSLHLGHLGLSNTLTDPSHNPYLGLAVPILRTNDVQRSQEFLCQKLQMEVGAVGSNSSQGTIYHNLLDHPWGRNPSPAWKFHPRAAPSTPNQPGGGGAVSSDAWGSSGSLHLLGAGCVCQSGGDPPEPTDWTAGQSETPGGSQPSCSLAPACHHAPLPAFPQGPVQQLRAVWKPTALSPFSLPPSHQCMVFSQYHDLNTSLPHWLRSK